MQKLMLLKKIMLFGLVMFLMLSFLSIIATADSCSSSYTLLRDENINIVSGSATVLTQINKGDRLVLGDTLFQYMGADKIILTNPEIKFKNIDTAETYTYSLEFNLEQNRAWFTFAWNGESYLFESIGDAKTNDFTIKENSGRVKSDTLQIVTLTAVEHNDILDRNQVRFSVNGKVTETLTIGDSYTADNGFKITVTDILYQAYAGGVHSATFCFDGEISSSDEESLEGLAETEPVTLEVNLKNYPNMFFKNGQLNAFIVVGSNAPATDNLAMNDIATGLQDKGYELNNAAKLESEINDPLTQNLIIIGRSSENAMIKQFLGNNNFLNPGEGMIKLFENNGYAQMIVTGYTVEDTRKAAKVLQNYDDYNLKGTEIIVTGNISNPQVHESDQPIVIEPEEPETEDEAEEPEPTPEVETPTKEKCTGCKINGNCLPYGTRLVKDGEQVYCNIDGTLQEQQELNDFCQNNYECSSNQCSNAKCIDLSGQIEEAKGILEKIFEWLKSIFG